MRYLFIILCFVYSNARAQSISQSVINSGGKTSTVIVNSQPIIYMDNIGESVVSTGSSANTILTQGFLQPTLLLINSTSVSIMPTDVSCADKADGRIKVIIENMPQGATVKYDWMPSSLCPSSDCSEITNLSAGSFSVTVRITYTVGTNVKTDSVFRKIDIIDGNGPCNIKPYKGVTLNGNNPYFTIENIEGYPEANVSIYNRWGKLMFSEKEYGTRNNWPGTNGALNNDGSKVTPGTYFYVIEFGQDKSVMKGWIEVFN